MKNKILFLSLALLSFTTQTQTPIDPDEWFNDSMDDDNDPNAKNAIGELLSAAKQQVPFSSQSTFSSKQENDLTPQSNDCSTESKEAIFKLEKIEAHLNEKERSKQLNRGLEFLGGAITVGAIVAYNYVENGINALGTVAVGAAGVVVIAWNEASARNKNKRINELKHKKDQLEEKQRKN